MWDRILDDVELEDRATPPEPPPEPEYGMAMVNPAVPTLLELDREGLRLRILRAVGERIEAMFDGLESYEVAQTFRAELFLGFGGTPSDNILDEVVVDLTVPEFPPDLDTVNLDTVAGRFLHAVSHALGRHPLNRPSADTTIRISPSIWEVLQTSQIAQLSHGLRLFAGIPVILDASLDPNQCQINDGPVFDWSGVEPSVPPQASP